EYHSAATPGAGDTLITNDVFYRIDRGWAIHVYPGTVPRIRILNNTFALPNPREPGHILLGANTSDAEIANNIFYSPRDTAIHYYSGLQTGLTLANNLVYGAVLTDRLLPGALVTGTRVADPLFVDAAAYDFHLRAASPAIGAGRSHASVTLDLDGTPRTGRQDAGALAFSARPPA